MVDSLAEELAAIADFAERADVVSEVLFNYLPDLDYVLNCQIARDVVLNLEGRS